MSCRKVFCVYASFEEDCNSLKLRKSMMHANYDSANTCLIKQIMRIMQIMIHADYDS